MENKRIQLSSRLFGKLSETLVIDLKGNFFTCSIRNLYHNSNENGIITTEIFNSNEKDNNSFDFNKNSELTFFKGLQPLNDNGKWPKDGRQSMKIGKFLRLFYDNILILEDVGDHSIETNIIKDRFIELMVAKFKGGHLEIKVSSDVSSIYGIDEDDNSGTLSHDCHLFANMYDQMDNLKIAYALNKDGELIGRALLWDNVKNENTGETFKFMDRIYGVESTIAAFKNWAINNGYLHKVKQSYSINDITDGNTNYDIKFSVDIGFDSDGIEGMPYMDSLFGWAGTRLSSVSGYIVRCVMQGLVMMRFIMLGIIDVVKVVIMTIFISVNAVRMMFIIQM